MSGLPTVWIAKQLGSASQPSLKTTSRRTRQPPAGLMGNANLPRVTPTPLSTSLIRVHDEFTSHQIACTRTRFLAKLNIADLSGQSLPVLTRWTEAPLKPSQTYSAHCNHSNQAFFLQKVTLRHGMLPPPARRAFRVASRSQQRSNEKKKCTNTDVRAGSQSRNAKSSLFWDWPV
jgi:hypothetical protein